MHTMIDRTVRRLATLAILASAILTLASASSHALQIIPTYDSTILNDANSAKIQATLNSTVGIYNSLFSNNETVSIKFQLGGGLGSSSTSIGFINYSNFYSAFNARATSPDQLTAVSHLTNTATNPVNDQTSMFLSTANLRALGFNITPAPGGFDGTITLNTSIMNLDRISIDSSKYDLQSVAQHEINEVLGLFSGLDNSANGSPAPSAISVTDLYRYDRNGNRSYTTDVSAESFFSIDGTNRLVQFNQDERGDFHDWFSIGNHLPRVQDAFGTPGATPDMNVEITALNVVGYQLSAVPEPTSIALVVVGGPLLVLALRSRARRRQAA
jgi:hypothetical protein